jgi:hypothetical protein
MTLTCVVFCRVTNEGVILMNLFMVQGHFGPMTRTIVVIGFK